MNNEHVTWDDSPNLVGVENYPRFRREHQLADF